MNAFRNRRSLFCFVLGLVFGLSVLALIAGNILTPHFRQTIDLSAYNAPTPVFRIASFSDLPGWSAADAARALPAFLRSCEAISERASDKPGNPLENLGPDYEGFSIAGDISDWLPACDAMAALKRINYASDAAFGDAVRVMFETTFTPIEVQSKRTPKPDGPARGRRNLITDTGAFTGYFEPLYAARRSPNPQFSAALYARPEDLIDVDLGAFRPELRGERIAGRRIGNRLEPFPDRRDINDGALGESGRVLAWLNPDDLFFLQIQGSGRLVFEDGAEMRVGYDGANGRAYTAIGRLLVQSGEMALEDVSMQSIRAWLDSAAEEQARDLREANASYVFFRELSAPAEGLGPLGAQGVALTPEVSLAVDRRFYPMGAPVYVAIERDSAPPIHNLMIAQDTGGAIRGPVRGDFFWGAGDAAGELAGAMNASGRMFLLAPRARADALRQFLAVR